MIWHRKVPPSGLWLCGGASTWQWRAQDTTRSTQQRSGRSRRTDPSSAGSASTGTATQYDRVRVVWVRRLRWLYAVWPHCLYRDESFSLRAVHVTALHYFIWSMLFLPECQWHFHHLRRVSFFPCSAIPTATLLVFRRFLSTGAAWIRQASGYGAALGQLLCV